MIDNNNWQQKLDDMAREAGLEGNENGGDASGMGAPSEIADAAGDKDDDVEDSDYQPDEHVSPKRSTPEKAKAKAKSPPSAKSKASAANSNRSPPPAPPLAKAKSKSPPPAKAKGKSPAKAKAAKAKAKKKK